jgi:hypothetical protein
MIGGGPPAEDPMPDDGVDPHPLPILNAGLDNPMAGNVPADDNAEWEDGHWAFNNGGNAVPNAGLGIAAARNAALQNLFDAMDEDDQANQPLQENHSSLTVTLFISKGDNSVNIPAGQALGQEVEQDIEDQFVVEENNNGPVIVQGDFPGANFDNFIQLGEGVQNIMLAYYDVDAENPQPQNNPPPADNDALGINDDVMFNDNDLVPPEVAHVHVGMALTHFFPIQNEMHLTEKFSEQGLMLWDKYFAPHLSFDASQEGFSAQIPVSWFNFITIMLMTPEKFDWTKNFLKSSLWEIISETDNNEPNIAFLIPEKCSVQSKPRCTISEVPEEEVAPDVLPPSAPTRKRRNNVHLVESEVRR